MIHRAVTRTRLEFIEVRIIDLKWKVEQGTVTRQEIVWALEKLEQQVRTTHADFVEEEMR